VVKKTHPYRYVYKLTPIVRVTMPYGENFRMSRKMRRGLRNSDQKPSRNRSSAVRLGASRRERLMISSCCFMSRLSATTVFAPPGPGSLSTVVNRWTRSNSRSFMAEQGREGCLHEQDCLSVRIQTRIDNSRQLSTLPGAVILIDGVGDKLE